MGELESFPLSEQQRLWVNITFQLPQNSSMVPNAKQRKYKDSFKLRLLSYANLHNNSVASPEYSVAENKL